MKWDRVNRELGGEDVSDALSLIDLILALPPTAVWNERGFSQLKLIKTAKRQKLTQKRLQGLLHVRLNGPEIEDFNPEASVQHWMVISCYFSPLLIHIIVYTVVIIINVFSIISGCM